MAAGRSVPTSCATLLMLSMPAFMASLKEKITQSMHVKCAFTATLKERLLQSDLEVVAMGDYLL